MVVLCISGKAEHGKTTVANILKEQLEELNKKVLIVHYGDLLKHICRSFFGWNGNKDDAGRTLLQIVGTNKIRSVLPDFWVSFVAVILSIFHDEWDYVLIPDCRFPNEVEYLRSHGFQAKLLRVVRENFENSLSEEQRRHPSEVALDNIAPDVRILNNGTLEDLKYTLRRLVSHISDGICEGIYGICSGGVPL